MKVTKVTINCSARRVANFQSVEHNISVEVNLEEGETTIEAIRKYQPGLQKMVFESTRDEVLRVADDQTQTNRESGWK